MTLCKYITETDDKMVETIKIHMTNLETLFLFYCFAEFKSQKSRNLKNTLISAHITYMSLKTYTKNFWGFECKPGSHVGAILLQMTKYPRLYLHQSYQQK